MGQQNSRICQQCGTQIIDGGRKAKILLQLYANQEKRPTAAVLLRTKICKTSCKMEKYVMG